MSRLSSPATALAVLALGCAPKSPASTDSGPAAAPVVHTWTSGAAGFDTHSHWVDTGAEVVVFDAQFTPALARELIADIQAETDSPIAAVVITHPNPDKFLGAPAFQELGAEVVASAATAAALAGVHAHKQAYFVGAGMFTAESFPALPAVDRTFTGALTLETAVPVRLVELAQGGVTTTQTVGIVGDHLFAGDLTAGRAHAWLEGGIVDGAPAPDLAAWDASLVELGGLAPDTAWLHPGRGEALPLATAVAEQRAYLATADAVVAEHVAQLDDPLAALMGPEAGAHMAAITAALASRYPEHTLAYLVSYGVYGLALDHAAR